MWRASQAGYASQVHEPTYSWMQRQGQITEFTALKDTVKKLERASREQLLLENESQGAFDHFASEIGRLRDAIGALSKVVDEEFASLRSEVASLRKDMHGVGDTARVESQKAAKELTATYKHDIQEVSRGLRQVQTDAAQLSVELKASRDRHQDLAGDVAKMDASVETRTLAVVQPLLPMEAISSLTERVVGVEQFGPQIKIELFDRFSEKMEKVRDEMRAEAAQGAAALLTKVERVEASVEPAANAAEQRSSAALSTAVTSLRHESERLQNEQTALATWASSARESLGALRADVDGARTVADGAATYAARLDTKVDDLHDATNVRLDGLRSADDQTDQAVEALSREVHAKLDGQREAFDGQRAALEARIDANKLEAANSLTPLRRAQDDAEAQLGVHSEQIAALKADSSAGVSELREALQEAEERTAHLAQGVGELTERVNGVDERVTAVGEHSKAVEGKIDSCVNERLPPLDAAVASGAADGQRHRDAIQLLVESVDNLSKEMQREDGTLGERIDELSEAAKSNDGSRAEQHAALAKLVDENDAAVREAMTDALKDALRQVDGRFTSLDASHEEAIAHITSQMGEAHQEVAGEAEALRAECERLDAVMGERIERQAQAGQRLADKLRATETEVSQLRQGDAELANQHRALKGTCKETSELLTSHKQQLKKTVDGIDRRQEAHEHAISVFAEALKLPNPLLHSAAAAL